MVLARRDLARLRLRPPPAMTHATKIAREQFITEALRAVDDAIGQEPPTDQALRMIEAIKRLRARKPVKVAALNPVDYLAKVQAAARAAWVEQHGGEHGNIIVTGPHADAVAGIDTPVGRLRMVIWRSAWSGRRGWRVVWRGEYYLDDEPITLAEIRLAGLAERPTKRNRKRRT